MTQPPSTPDLCDAHPDRVRVLEPMLANFGGHTRFAGTAVTVRCFEDNSLVKDQCAQPGRGRVLVVDGGGSRRRALMGDQVAAAAVANGWAGAIIHGCIRDIDAIAELELGVRALASVPVKTDKRGVGELDVPVSFAGVIFNPGDWVCADHDGIIVADRELSLDPPRDG